ncbi:hypothetical protein EDC96DRAFT_545275 [Choanephora cucurbitarum]|nr:hypothetical protein EDC96DRAFT_545275 [Choanephora cucurbitarum]
MSFLCQRLCIFFSLIASHALYQTLQTSPTSECYQSNVLIFDTSDLTIIVLRRYKAKDVMTSHTSFSIIQNLFSAQNAKRAVFFELIYFFLFEQVDELKYEEIKQWLPDSLNERIYIGNGTISFKQKAIIVANYCIASAAYDCKFRLSRANLSSIFRNANRKRAFRRTNLEKASASSNDHEGITVIVLEEVTEHLENSSGRGSIFFNEFMNELQMFSPNLKLKVVLELELSLNKQLSNTKGELDKNLPLKSVDDLSEPTLLKCQLKFFRNIAQSCVDPLLTPARGIPRPIFKVKSYFRVMKNRNNLKKVSLKAFCKHVILPMNTRVFMTISVGLIRLFHHIIHQSTANKESSNVKKQALSYLGMHSNKKI